MECETKNNPTLNKVKISDLKRRERNCRAASRHMQTTKRSNCGEPARTAANELQSGTISHKVEREECAATQPTDKTWKYSIPEGRKAARQRKNIKQAEYPPVCRKRRLGGSTPSETPSSSHSTLVLTANSRTDEETWLSLVKTQVSVVHNRASGVSCTGLQSARKKEVAIKQEPTPTINRRAVEAGSQVTHERRCETDDRICSRREDCDPQDPESSCRSGSVPEYWFPCQTPHQTCPFGLLGSQRGALKPSCTRCVTRARLSVACERSRRRSTETGSSAYISQSPCREAPGPHTSGQEHVTALATQDLPATTLCHVKCSCSGKNMEAYRSPRDGHSRWLTLSANSAGREECTPFLSQKYHPNPHFSQASFISERLSGQDDGLPDACKSCLFVHPYLLLPLLPPASVFTNPCWPPTPPKKRRVLHYGNGTYRSVSSEVAGTAAGCRRIVFADNTSGTHYRRPLSRWVSGSCSFQASTTDEVPSRNSIAPAAGITQGNNSPCKTCAPAAKVQKVNCTDKGVEPAHRERGIEEEGKQSEVLCRCQRTPCHKAETKHCLIEGGHLFQCACCSPWVPRRAAQLVKHKRACSDKQADCATTFMGWIHHTEPHRDNHLEKVENTCCKGSASGWGQRVDAVPYSTQGDARKQFEKKLHQKSLMMQERRPVCDFAGGGDTSAASKSLSDLVPARSGHTQDTRNASELYVASERASALVEWRAIPKRQRPGGNVADNAASTQGQTQMIFEEPTPQAIFQDGKSALLDGLSLFKTGLPQGKYADFEYSPLSITTHKLTVDFSGIKGEKHRAAGLTVKEPHSEVRPHVQRMLLADKSHSRLCAHCHNSASVGRRPALCALPARHDRSFNKSGFSGSVLLPSIGCGLAVAQSSLGRGSGLGLYALRPFSARSRISEYGGLCVDRKVAMLLRSMGTSTHVMRVGMQHQYLVGYRLPFLYGAAGAFVNDGRWYADGRRGPGVGARFQVVYDKKRARDRVYVVATRDIKAGEEIFTSYDNLYWALME